MKNLTIAIPYYEAPKMLEEQLRSFIQYPEGRVKLIVVDDGSPTKPAEPVLRNISASLDVELYRIKQDIPWNISGAMNLAFKHAPDGWVYSFAVDHVVPPEAMENLLGLELSPEHFYRMRRVEKGNGERCERFGNLFLLTKKLFWRVGGYDEDFAGYYGGTGPMFRRAMEKITTEIVLPDNVWNLRYENEDISDACVTTLQRKKQDQVRNNRTLNMKQKRENYNPRNYIRFDWEKVDLKDY